MIEKFDGLKKRLSELATVLNAFKSEAVQLRILDLVFGEQAPLEIADQLTDDETTRKVRIRRMPKKKTDAAARQKKKIAPAGTGAPATLTQLLSGNFFDKARTINDIIEHCKHNLARTFKANEFSGKLGRMVRTGELTRKKNADKQYEYKKS
jgi:hypothetical protein